MYKCVLSFFCTIGFLFETGTTTIDKMSTVQQGGYIQTQHNANCRVITAIMKRSADLVTTLRLVIFAMEHVETVFISYPTVWDTLTEYTEMYTLSHLEGIILNVKMKDLSMMAEIPVKPTWHLIMAD
ncbi:hypothetical protein AM593_09946, partial [Mytilus galloprovincialis]